VQWISSISEDSARDKQIASGQIANQRQTSEIFQRKACIFLKPWLKIYISLMVTYGAKVLAQARRHHAAGLFIIFGLFLAPGASRAGSIVAWGSGLGTNMPPLTNVSILGIAAGLSHGLAVRADGSVTSWGNNSYFQTNVPADLANVVAVAAGTYHSLALKADGTVVAWGRNQNAQSTVPADLTNVQAIAAGDYHSLALKRDGTAVNWGKYRDDNIGSAVLPLPANLSNIVAIASGENHDLFLRRDGTIFVWGWNGAEQTNLPPGLSGVMAVGAGGDDCLAIKTNGIVYCWGRDNHSQAQAPPNLTNATAVAGGSDHNLAIRSNGTVAAWGSNQSGQTSVPPGLSNVVAIAGGFEFSLALVGGGSASPFLTANNPLYSSGTFSVSVATASGKSYQLEYKDSLSDTNWTSLSPSPGDGNVKMLTDPAAAGPRRFYRVKQF
jgi:hypothetical protein